MLVTIPLAVLVCLLGAAVIALARYGTVVDHNEAYCVVVDGQPRTVTGLDITTVGRSASKTRRLHYGPTRLTLTRPGTDGEQSVSLAVTVTDPETIWRHAHHTDDPVIAALQELLDDATADGTPLSKLDPVTIHERANREYGVEIDSIAV